MQFLYGMKERHWKTHPWRNLRCLYGRKSFEQIVTLVWVKHKTAGNHSLKSLYSLVYFWSLFCKTWLMITPAFMLWGLVCVFLSSLFGKALPNTGFGAAVTLAVFIVFVFVTCCLCLSFPTHSHWAEDAVTHCEHEAHHHSKYPSCIY